MKLFRFDRDTGFPVDQHGSISAAFSYIVMTITEARVGCMYIEPGGLIGYHSAALAQVFLVVQGEGWVRGEEAERRRIAAGQAAFWQAGEGHESGSESGMTAIIIQSASLDPASYMPELRVGG